MRVYSTVVRIKVTPKLYDEGFRGIMKNLQDNSSGAIDVIVKLEANKDNAGFIIKKVKELGEKRYLYHYTRDLTLNSLYAFKRSHFTKTNISFDLRSKFYDEVFMAIITELETKVDGTFDTELTIPITGSNVDFIINQIEELYGEGYITEQEKDKHIQHLNSFIRQLRPKLPFHK